MAGRILICGASGFIGRHLFAALTAAGRDCVRGVRDTESASDVRIDYLRDVSPEDWYERLEGIDVVINTIGVLRDTRKTPMQLLHSQAPAALFRACADRGVKRIVNISALGVDAGINTAYFRTKLQAEQQLAALPDSIRWLNLRPSVVYGEDGTSAAMFRLQARLPLHMLPMGGSQLMQPVHIDDLCKAVVNWLDGDHESACITASGADVVSMREMLDSYRRQQGYGSALHIPVPGLLMKLAARAGDLLPASPLCSETLEMLQAGNTGDNSDFARLLGCQPRSVHQFIRSNSHAQQ